MADEEKPSWRYDHDMRVWAGKNDRFPGHMSAVAQFAALAIQSIILANSAAAGAVLAMLGTMWKTDAIAGVLPASVYSLKVFGIGIFVGMLAAAFSYVAQFCYSESDMSDETSRRARTFKFTAWAFHFLGVAGALIGIAAFAWGAWNGIDVLAVSNGGLSR